MSHTFQHKLLHLILHRQTTAALPDNLRIIAMASDEPEPILFLDEFSRGYVPAPIESETELGQIAHKALRVAQPRIPQHLLPVQEEAKAHSKQLAPDAPAYLKHTKARAQTKVHMVVTD